MFIPRDFQQHMPSCNGHKRTWCQWCCERGALKDMFKVRDEPVDWYFCDAIHYEQWLKHRCCWPVSEVLKMPPKQRRQAFLDLSVQGWTGHEVRTTAQFVSELTANGFIKECDDPADGVRYVHYGNLPLPKAAELPP